MPGPVEVKWGGSLLFNAIPCYPPPPKITKQTIHQLSTDQIWPLSSCTSTFPGGWGWVVIKLKANLSSTSHLTSQLELSLPKKKQNEFQLVGQKLFGPNKFLVYKKILVKIYSPLKKKSLSEKNFWSKKSFWSKNLVKRFFGWVGDQYFSLRDPYISNLRSAR